MSISHITLICKNPEKTALLFKNIFRAEEVYSSEKKNFSLSFEKFLLIGDLWIALMEGPSTSRSYNHIAFKVPKEELPHLEEKIKEAGLEILPSRPHAPEEGQSLYFYDYDNHLFELHTGDLFTRLAYYRKLG